MVEASGVQLIEILQPCVRNVDDGEGLAISCLYTQAV